MKSESWALPTVITARIMQILRDDTGPRSSAISALARRLLAIRWLSEPFGLAHRTELAVAHAIASLRTGSGVTAQAPTEIVGPSEAASLLEKTLPHLLQPRGWASLESLRETATDRLLRGSAAEDHPVFARSGNSLLVRPGSLPIDRRALDSALSRTLPDTAPNVRRHLGEVVQDQAAVSVAWQTTADEGASDPHLGLWALYEEGLFPFEISENRTLLLCPWK